jgi:hypothetical protein
VKIRWVDTRSAARLAWSLWVACLGLVALALLLDFLHTHDILYDPWQTLKNYRLLYPIYAVLTGMLSLVYPTIGALIVSRLPKMGSRWYRGRGEVACFHRPRLCRRSCHA